MTSPPRFDRILLTTAFGELSRRALPYVFMLARAHDSELHVLHVVTPRATPVQPLPLAESLLVPIADTTQLLDAARSRLQNFVREEIEARGLKARAALDVGVAHEQIIAYAARARIDLIVMGTHGSGMLKRMVFGSVTKAVVEHASCAVLLVPCHDEPAARADAESA